MVVSAYVVWSWHNLSDAKIIRALSGRIKCNLGICKGAVDK